MSIDIVLHYLVALAYLALGGSICLPIYQNKTIAHRSAWRRAVLLLVIILHGIAIHVAMLHKDHLQLNWSLSLSFTMWLGMIVFWIECNLVKVINLLFPLSVPTAITCILAAAFPAQNATQIVIDSELFRLHLVISLFAYSLIALATLQAIITALLDRYLHRPQDFNHSAKFTERVIESQPPLLVQERLLFSLIWVGFTLLTISVITGMWISLQTLGVPLPQNHKTVFTLLAWIIFAFLLTGRTLWGWRGRLALRWTLTGFVLLMLAYTGTRFVLEVILHR